MKNETKNEITTVPQEVQITPESFIAQAVNAGAPVETIEKLIQLQERVNANRAREAYNIALNKFQGDCPTIEKNKKVNGKDGKVRYQYATLDAIVEAVRPLLKKYELSYTISATQTPEGVCATAKITHILGHSEESSFTVPIDKEGYMTAPQKVASALTFAKRYAFTNALGILTGDEDTDATDVKPDKKPKNIKSQIIFLLRELGEDTATKQSCEKAVKKLTGVGLLEKNYEEIKEKLTIVLDERNSDVTTA
jgi:hypothetical protein